VDEQPKKRGLFRSILGGFGRFGWWTTKNTAKVVAKGGYITIRTGGKVAIFAARNAFPRRESESRKEYRIRMAKLGFKVSLFTGQIVAMYYGAHGVAKFLRTIDQIDTGISLTTAAIDHLTPETDATQTGMNTLPPPRLNTLPPPRLNAPPPPRPPGLY
jgi:hypothetical protein